MSIQRYDVTYRPEEDPQPWSEGRYVTYADHVAAYDDVKGRAYLSGAEAMRAACIAAVEAMHPSDLTDVPINKADVITILREVQP